jgi:hypothetical protein
LRDGYEYRREWTTTQTHIELLLENTSSPASTISPVATREQKRTEELKNPITKTVNWKPDIDDGWTLVKRKMRSQQKIESNQSIVNS